MVAHSLLQPEPFPCHAAARAPPGLKREVHPALARDHAVLSSLSLFEPGQGGRWWGGDGLVRPRCCPLLRRGECLEAQGPVGVRTGPSSPGQRQRRLAARLRPFLLGGLLLRSPQ